MRGNAVIVIGLRKTERRNLISAPLKKIVKKANPVNQNFAKLRKKIKKLEKALKKSSKKARKRRYKDSNSNSK